MSRSCGTLSKAFWKSRFYIAMIHHHVRSLVFFAVSLSVVQQGYSDPSSNEGRQGKDIDMCGASLMSQGVYVPDDRFNAFVDGVMINTATEIRRKKMDPLYFRVHTQGIIEHVPTGNARNRRSVGGISPDRQSALGGGVIRGTSNIKRFGTAEVQIAGNTTLIRSHWLMGPLFIIIDYRGEPSITRVRTEIEAVQFDTLTAIDKFGADMEDFKLYGPIFDYMAYFGNRTMIQQRTTEHAVRQLFSSNSFMAQLLKEAFQIASYDKIIPQFGVDDNYYSVLQYLFRGQQGREARIDLEQYQEERQKQLLSYDELLAEEKMNSTDLN